MGLRNIIIIFLVVINLSAIAYYVVQREKPGATVVVLPIDKQDKSLNVPITVTNTIEVEKKKEREVEIAAVDTYDEDEIGSEVVNEYFRDTPAVQKAWVARGKDIILQNKPGAGSANFRSEYFHRGFKDNAMVCGEIELLNDGVVVEGFQRFIFPGGVTAYYENNIKNFDVLWSKLCVQVFEN